MKTNLLIDEYPLQVIPSLAVKIGLNEAIAIQQLHYWMGKNVGKIIDGKKWVFNSYAKWKEDNFPFWSEATIKRIFASLEEKNLISTMQLGTYDRRKYYTINYDDLDTIVSNCTDASGQNDLMEEVKMTSCNGSDCSDVNTETTQETTKEITKDIVNVSSFQNQTDEEFYEQAALVRKEEPFGQLFDAFLEHTGMHETMISGRALDPIREWVKWGVTKDHIKQAVQQLQEKEYNIVRPASIDNALKIVMTKKGKTNDDKDISDGAYV